PGITVLACRAMTEMNPPPAVSQHHTRQPLTFPAFPMGTPVHVTLYQNLILSVFHGRFTVAIRAVEVPTGLKRAQGTNPPSTTFVHVPVVSLIRPESL